MCWILKIIGETVVKDITIRVFQLGKKKLFSFIPFLQAKENNEQLILHIALPSDPEGPARGDAILQGAGFLAAKEQFGDRLTIKFHDHKGDNVEIRRIIKEEIVGEPDKKTPIWAIFTMSNVSQTVYDEFNSISNDDPTIKDRLSILFTVSSAPKTPSDMTNYFQHFITGDSEAAVIENHCKTIKDHENLDRPRVHFLGMNTPYSSEIIEYLSFELMKNKFTCTYIELSDDGCISKNDQDEIEHNSNENTFCIVVAYDICQLKALETLSEIKYKGHVISTTTLSVPDWQEYLRRKKKSHINSLKIKHVAIKDFGKFCHGYKTFCKDLEKFTFDKVTAETDLYPKGVDWTREQFDCLEKEVYQNILPNYISAFCYDSVRLFFKLAELKEKSLMPIYNNSEKYIKSEKSPFCRTINTTKYGRVNITLSVKELSL